MVSNSGASGPDAGQAPAGGAGTPAPAGASPSAANLGPVSPLVRRDPMRADRSGPSAPPVASLSGYVWPIAHPRLTLPFGPTGFGSWLVDGQLFHDGVDLATFCGDRIDAAHAGTVLAAGRHYDEFMGWLGDLGPYVQRLDAKQLWTTLPIIVVIDDGNGYRSIYAHFSRIVVKAGENRARRAAAGLRRHDGPGDRLPPALRPVLAVRRCRPSHCRRTWRSG